jgi:putative tryptophan/tyrosine transport system substrate-binding protein
LKGLDAVAGYDCCSGVFRPAIRDRRYAAELVALTPDIILASGTSSVAALTRALPIVFVTVSDPVGAGFVDTLA